MTEQDAEVMIRQGLEALRQGRASDARTCFETVTASGSASSVAWLLLAMSRRADDDRQGEEAALNRLLEIEPQSVRGHVMKGDCRAYAGDESSAAYFYRRALRLAEGKQLPQEVMAEVQRTEQAVEDLDTRAHAARQSSLTARGFPPESWSPRFRHSLELAAGERKLYQQAPTVFHYPELPQIQFYDTREFDWVPAVEAAAATIRQELMDLLEANGTDDFRAYIDTNSSAIPMSGDNKKLVQNEDWSALFLCENGQTASERAKRCPRTLQALAQAPLPTIPGWGPTIMFSLLKGGARIAPHTGMFNTRLVCHLPLIVPSGCRFRVGNEIREWEEGEMLIFDDTFEHEAWNDSAEDRVILIFDIWRPELSQRERHELTALFSK